MRKKAFTIAECLITISILGLIASLTLPALYVNIQTSELRIQFQKTFSDLNKFAQYIVDEHDVSAPKYTNIYGVTKLHNEFKNYMINTKKTGAWTDASGRNSGAKIDYKYHLMTNPTGATATGSICDNSGFFTDGLGRIVAFDDAPKAGYNGPRICVDINGVKAPNTYGLDMFSFLFTVDGKVIPEGASHRNSNVTDVAYDYKRSVGWAWQAGTITGAENCHNSSYGQTCAHYALNDISPLNDKESYWNDFVGKKKYLKTQEEGVKNKK